MNYAENLKKIFKAYDVRGIYPAEIDENAAYAIGQAVAAELGPQKIIVGRDARTMNPGMQDAATSALRDAGVDVLDIGLITTDMLYFASGYFNLPGIAITASHNPAGYTGMKIVRAGAVAISSDSGLLDIHNRAVAQINNPSQTAARHGVLEKTSVLAPYLEHILSFVNREKIKPIKVVANANFGPASIVAQELAKILPLAIVPLDFEIDGSFPKGRPDPLIPERRTETSELIKKSGADFGVAWDGDADRCFFWDENGNFINPYYIGIILAERNLKKTAEPSPKIIHCARAGMLFDKIVREAGGTTLQSRVGHSFIKDMMRREDVLFGAEISGHYYFRNNYFADNGMIPFLLMLELLSETGQPFSELTARHQKAMLVSDEINFTIPDPNAIITELEDAYRNSATIEHSDGLTLTSGNWRANLRPANTEPLLRLNVEAVDDKTVNRVVQQITTLINRT